MLATYYMHSLYESIVGLAMHWVLAGDAIDSLPRDGHSDVILHTILNFECALFELSTPTINLRKMRTCISLFFILQVTDSWVQDWE